MSAFDKATIAHIGIAVKDIEEQIKVWRDQLGLPFEGTDEVPGVKIAFFPLGEGSVELVQSTDPESGLAKFVEQKGGGMHHLCIRVPDINAALAELKQKGLKLIDEKPRTGAYLPRWCRIRA